MDFNAHACQELKKSAVTFEIGSSMSLYKIEDQISLHQKVMIEFYTWR